MGRAGDASRPLREMCRVISAAGHTSRSVKLGGRTQATACRQHMEDQHEGQLWPELGSSGASSTSRTGAMAGQLHWLPQILQECHAA